MVEESSPERDYSLAEVAESAAARQYTWRNIRLIIRREYKYRVTQRSFIISSIILLAVVAVADFTPTAVQYFTSPPATTQPTSREVAGFAFALGGAFLMYVSVAIYGSTVAVGVAEEKTSRVMEVMLTAATPFQLMVGKIVGIGAAALTQMASLVVVGISALLLQIPIQAALFGTTGGGLAQYLAAISVPLYLLFLVYFLLDFFLYATLYAGLGALVRRQEEVQSATAVPSVLIGLGWVLVLVLSAAPSSPWVIALSYVPFLTPTFMMLRLGVGTVVWWEVVLTIGLMLVTIYAFMWFSARLYRHGVLMYGQRPSLIQLIKIVRTG